MQIGGSDSSIAGMPSTMAGVQAQAPVSNRRAELQSNLLKKILESQQRQADLAANEMEGKGQNLDIRA